MSTCPTRGASCRLAWAHEINNRSIQRKENQPKKQAGIKSKCATPPLGHIAGIIGRVHRNTQDALFLWLGSQLGELTSEVFPLQKSSCGVACNRHGPEHLSSLIFYHRKAHVHIDLLTILMQRTCNE
jgi:hypothetical protein